MRRRIWISTGGLIEEIVWPSLILVEDYLLAVSRIRARLLSRREPAGEERCISDLGVRRDLRWRSMILGLDQPVCGELPVKRRRIADTAVRIVRYYELNTLRGTELQRREISDYSEGSRIHAGISRWP